MPKYRTAPFATDRMPPGIPYIIWNEAAERFSFYGMKTILIVFMTRYLLDSTHALAPMGEENAKFWFHTFVAAVYFTPFLGALISDGFLGKYRTIMALSLVYCAGHFALAADETRVGLGIGLTLIAIGAGGIKPCVSANVGDQFGKSNAHLLNKVFGWFYWSINLGAFASTMLTPWLLNHYSSRVAFGVPGVLMCIATLAFWLGRNKFAHIPPAGPGYFRESFTGENLRTLGRLAIIYLFAVMYWSLYDQSGSAWVLQAENMNLKWLSVTWLPSQIQAFNPLLIMALIPVFSYAVYPALGRVFRVTPLRKIGIGFFMCAATFVLSAQIEHWIALGQRPSIAWQLLAYVILTCSEVLVSITCLEFAYEQAPPKMKSLIMSFYLLSMSLGNEFTAVVNKVIQDDQGHSRLTGVTYYLFFAAAMLVVSLLFIPVAARYREKTYIQDETPEAPPEQTPPALSMGLESERSG